MNSLTNNPERSSGAGSPSCRSHHAQHLSFRRLPAADRIAVQRLRRSGPRCRTRHRRSNRLILRTQRARRRRLLPPLARCPGPRRHHRGPLERCRTDRGAVRRVPLPGRLDRRLRRRPRTRHPVRSQVVHGDRNRGTATPTRRDQERPPSRPVAAGMQRPAGASPLEQVALGRSGPRPEGSRRVKPVGPRGQEPPIRAPDRSCIGRWLVWRGWDHGGTSK